MAQSLLVFKAPLQTYRLVFVPCIFDIKVAVRYSEGTTRFCADVGYSSKVQDPKLRGFLCNMPMERGLCSWNFVADNPSHINTVKVETCLIDTRTPIYVFCLHTDCVLIIMIMMYYSYTYGFVLIVYAYVRLSCVVGCPHLKDPDFQNYMIFCIFVLPSFTCHAIRA